MKTRYDIHSFSVLGGYFTYIAIIVFILTTVSCKEDTPITPQLHNHEIEQEYQQPIKPISLQQIPVFKQIMDYITLHYWDNFNYSEMTGNSLEQAIGKFIEIIPHSAKNVTYAAINESLERAAIQQGALARFLDIYEIYFYNPNSPFRNDEYYIPVLQYVVNSDDATEGDRLRAKFRLEMALKNRIKTQATDITYTLASGKSGTLYDIPNQLTLLMFYNPDCHSCEEVIAYIEESPIMSMAIERGDVGVLAFYPDSDLSIWKRNLKKIPASWINGYDKNGVVKSQLLYDLKAIPTLYLLDKNKVVLLKDADLEIVELYLRQEIANKI